MVGKSYTMKELKMIVDYLVDHEAYSETKGKKMWINFANSQVTSRTWQSLKQTYLKRILPDIHNPYFKLTTDQIRSFREGCNILKKNNNKLEIRTTSDDDSSNNVEKIDEDTSNNVEEDSNSGEAIKCSKVPSQNRSSVETLILENCSNTDVENESLENIQNEDNKSVKSTRDFITYLEPLTPLLQEVLHDFETDTESDIEQVKIVEDGILVESEDILNSASNYKSNKKENINAATKSKGGITKEAGNLKENSVASKAQDNSDAKIMHEERKTGIDTNSKDNTNNDSESKTKSQEEKSSENSSLPLTDGTLPNNPEALAKKITNSKDNLIGLSEQQEISKNDQNLIATKRNGDILDESITKKFKNSKSVEPANQDSALNEITGDNVPVLKIKESNIIKEKEAVTNEKTGDISSSAHDSQDMEMSIVKNPCLNSVSLYAEQFSTVKYSSTDSCEMESTRANKKSKQQANKIFKKSSEVVEINEILESKSNSDTNIKQNAVNEKHSISRDKHNAKKDNILANVFGFSKGGAPSHRRHVSYRKSASHSTHTNIDYVSSGWTSESDSDFVAPPRGRRNKNRYLKPQSARIMSLEEEGGLFVMHGKKVYPLVKDGKILKRYLTYMSDSEDDDESYWKLKYVEEKKKTAELAKLLKKPTETINIQDTSSILPELNENFNKHNCKNINEDKKLPLEPINEKTSSEKTVKIKYTKKDKEVQLEGHWSQINPILEQVVQMFGKDSEPNPEPLAIDQLKDCNSIGTSPITIPAVDEEVKEKVDMIEGIIFKEIEKIESAETSSRNDQQVTNVTERKRKGRKGTSSTSVIPSQSSEKKLKSTDVDDADGPKTKIHKTSTVKRFTRLSNRKSNLNNNNVDEANKPSNPQKKKKANEGEDNEISFWSNLSVPADHVSADSIESTQDYQDSDISPMKIMKKKRKNSITAPSRTQQRNGRRKSLQEDVSNDSNSISQGPIQSMIFQNSSVNTDVYKSESYQMLFPQKRRANSQLDRIEENNLVNQFEAFNSKDLKIRKTVIMSPRSDTYKDSIQINVEMGNSSGISLPLSPEISVVQNISINRNMISDVEEPPLNETNQNHDVCQTRDKFMLSGVDFSVPLMEQQCEFHNEQVSEPNEPGIKKIVTGTKDSSISNSLHQKLQNLLLESARKTSLVNSEQQRETFMDIDINIPDEKPKKDKPKRRCSTPCKKKNSKKRRTLFVDAVIDEHTENCSYGRKSCPPIISEPMEENLTKGPTKNIEKKEPKKSKKKDIIKVKITRPSKDKAIIDKPSPNGSKTSTKTDSGINETESGVFLQGLDDSVDIELIHNHSDTCLHGNECIENSVQFVSNSKSIISLNTTVPEDFINDLLEIEQRPGIASQIFCNDAQDAIGKNTSPETAYYTPKSETSANSLLTEDLSEERLSQEQLSQEQLSQERTSKWYLLSEDDTTNTNFFTCDETSNIAIRSNLQDIFPVICTVPELSTITEMSESSRKPAFDTDCDSKCFKIV